ncbi:MAG: hypothetical protein IJE00_07850 [Clostridia bacterium]|nr:hypothetical protein [Clostridia bacterium]
MKKILAFLLAMILMFALVACGNSGNGDQTGGTTTTAFVKPENYAAVLQLTVNPQFRLYLDAAGVVLAVEYANADALSLKNEMTVVSAGYEAAITTILTTANDEGMVKTDAVVQLELIEKKDNAPADLLDKSETAVKNLSVTLNLSLTVQVIAQPASTASSTTTTTTGTTTTTTAATTTTTTTTTKATTTTTAAPANKNPKTDLEFDLEYIGNFIDQGSMLDASALQFESVEGGVCVVTARMFEAERSDPNQVPFEYYGKQWYSVGGGLDPHYYELTATEIIVKGSLWGDNPDAVNIRLVLQADGTLKVTEVCSDLMERFPVGTVMKIYFR